MVGQCISDSGNYMLISGSDNESTLIFQGVKMGQGKEVVASFHLVIENSESWCLFQVGACK
jgi:hypothetical protein